MRALVTLITILLLAAGCSTAAGPAPGSTGGAAGETSVYETEASETVVEQIAEGQRGLAERQVIVAGSAGELAEATGLEVPESGEGLYVSAHAGERPTGGYRVTLSDAVDAGVRVTLREPGQGDIVTQAFTQPYAVAVVRGSGLDAGDLRFVDGQGERIDWPIRRVDETSMGRG